MAVYVTAFSNKRGFLDVKVQNLTSNFIEEIAEYNSRTVIYRGDNYDIFAYDSRTNKVHSVNKINSVYELDEFLDKYGLIPQMNMHIGEEEIFGNVKTCTCGGRITYNEPKNGPHSASNHSTYCDLITSGIAK